MNILRHRAVNDNAAAHDVYENLVREIECAIGRTIGDDEPFEAAEKLLLLATNESVRRHLEKRLQRIADSFSERVCIGRHEYKRHQPGSARYFSLCGAMTVERWTYRNIAERNGPTVVPLDLAAGLARGATPALAFALAQGVAKAPVRSVEQDLKAAYRSPPSRTTMDRIARHLGTLVHECVDQIEPRLRAREKLPSDAMAINIGLDRTTIPMEEHVELANGEAKCAVKYRMAYVGTVSITNKSCDVLVTRRYAAPAHDGPERILERMKADLEHALDQNANLNVGVVQDGAPEMWNLVRDTLRKIPRLAPTGKRIDSPPKWRETIDRYHLMEKLADVLEVLVPDDVQKRSDLYATWNTDLDRHNGAIKRIDAWIVEHSRKASREVANEVENIVRAYFCDPKQFRYATLRTLGLQQGSGVTEGACKSLIMMRAKRSGQRWRPLGISALLAIRCLLDSDRLDRFWPRFARRFHASVRSAA